MKYFIGCFVKQPLNMRVFNDSSPATTSICPASLCFSSKFPLTGSSGLVEELAQVGMEGKGSAGFHGDEVLGCGAVDVFGLSKKGREDVFIKTSLSHHKHLSLLLSASLSFSHPLLEINKLIKSEGERP